MSTYEDDVAFFHWYQDLMRLIRNAKINFNDPDAVRDDFDAGKTIEEVFEDIRKEYDEYDG